MAIYAQRCFRASSTHHPQHVTNFSMNQIPILLIIRLTTCMSSLHPCEIKRENPWFSPIINWSSWLGCTRFHEFFYQQPHNVQSYEHQYRNYFFLTLLIISCIFSLHCLSCCNTHLYSHQTFIRKLKKSLRSQACHDKLTGHSYPIYWINSPNYFKILTVSRY